jgi:hypothetical protein
MTEHVKAEIADGVMTLTLQRPIAACFGRHDWNGCRGILGCRRPLRKLVILSAPMLRLPKHLQYHISRLPVCI